MLQPHKGSSETWVTASSKRPAMGFNPTRVRLKLGVHRADLCFSTCFNPTRVRLKLAGFLFPSPMSWMLQPHKGSSETMRFNEGTEINAASTPQGFV